MIKPFIIKYKKINHSQNNKPFSKTLLKIAISNLKPLLISFSRLNVNFALIIILFPSILMGMEQKLLLHEAAQRGDTDTVRALILENRVNINERNNKQETALYCAAAAGNVKIVRILLSYDADPNIPDATGQTALHRAARAGNSSIALLLLNCKADPNAKEFRFNTTPVMKAVYSDSEETVDLLLKDDARVDDVDASGNTPLHTAVLMGKLGVVQILIYYYNAPLDLQNGAGYTPLQIARQKNNTDCITMMMNALEERIRKQEVANFIKQLASSKGQ